MANGIFATKKSTEQIDCIENTCSNSIEDRQTFETVTYWMYAIKASRFQKEGAKKISIHLVFVCPSA